MPSIALAFSKTSAAFLSFEPGQLGCYIFLEDLLITQFSVIDPHPTPLGILLRRVATSYRRSKLIRRYLHVILAEVLNIDCTMILSQVSADLNSFMGNR